MSNLDQVVFVVDGEEIVEGAIRSFDGFIDETTTPYGVAPRLHTRGHELWDWGLRGNSPRRLQVFASDDDAIEALENSFAEDFWSCESIPAFNTRGAAEEYLAEIRAELGDAASA